MAVSLNMGVEGVSYQPAVDRLRTDYPRSKVNLPVGASIPSHVDGVFRLDASEQVLTAAIKPRLANPYVTVPANYRTLFAEIEAATSEHAGDHGETGRIVQSARALLLSMKTDFAAFENARNALIKA